MTRVRAHAARLVGLSDGARAGHQNVLLYLAANGCREPCAVALSLDDARRLLAGLAAILPEVQESQQDLTQAN